MNSFLLSGGSGERLWTLSNEIRLKPFLKTLKQDDGTHESMVKRMYRMMREVDSNASIKGERGSVWSHGSSSIGHRT